MSTPFTPGELTGPQARALNELARVAEQFSRLTVTAPLSLTRPAGIPAIRLDTTTLKGDLLAEITGHTGTPPVHTAKRKTRDTSNDVVDYSPLETFTQVLNPHEIAYSIGTLVELVAIPDWPDWYWGFAFGAGGSPIDVPCETHGWLSDRDALISRASNTPKGVFTYEVFDGLGRCACIEEQGRDPTDIPYPYTAFYDSTSGKWIGSVLIDTCCGCARLEISVKEYNGDTTDDWPPISVMLKLFGGNCDESGTTDYPLNYQCATNGCAVFAGAGPKVCNDAAPYPCDNSFIVTICCADCTLENASGCDYCYESCDPPILVLDWRASSFSGGNAWLNDIWYLPYVGGCTWRLSCGTIEISIVAGLNGLGQGTLTLTIGGVGTWVYTSTSDPVTNLVQCFTGHTLDRTSGDAGTTPATLPEGPVYCDPCTGCTDFADLTATIASSDDCGCMAGEYSLPVITTVEGVQSWESDIAWTDCGGGLGQIIASCHCNSDGTSTIRATVICGASNTGTGAATFATCDMAALNVTIPISMTDPGAGSCTGTCDYSFVGMTGLWQLDADNCTGTGCNDCPNEPVNPPADPIDGQTWSENCTGGTGCECCCGDLTLTLTIAGGMLRMETAPAAIKAAPVRAATKANKIEARVKKRGCQKKCTYAWSVLLDGVPQEQGQADTEAGAWLAANDEAKTLAADLGLTYPN